MRPNAVRGHSRSSTHRPRGFVVSQFCFPRLYKLNELPFVHDCILRVLCLLCQSRHRFRSPRCGHQPQQSTYPKFVGHEGDGNFPRVIQAKQNSTAHLVHDLQNDKTSRLTLHSRCRQSASQRREKLKVMLVAIGIWTVGVNRIQDQVPYFG